MFPALIAMAILGGVLGLVLAVASKKFHVETDPRVEQVLAALPGANCGACGQPGCAGYAEAVVLRGAAVNLCSAGGAACAKTIAAIMGVEATAAEPAFATCSCQKQGVTVKYVYDGPRSCKAANSAGLAGGMLSCTHGCLGLGDCAAACPFGALTLGSGGLPIVDEEKCTGCRKCVAACPRGLMRVDPESRVVLVACINKDKGGDAAKLCERACIVCRKCEKECPRGAISMVDNLAVIDYAKCDFCGKCVPVCPRNIIVDLGPERKRRKDKRAAAVAAGE